MRAIRRGEADLVIAGGYDDATSWWSMTKMDGLGVLSRRNDLGQQAFRPYDQDHSGSVLGEGAALLVLEDRDSALARGAHCYAEITGFGGGNDAVRAPSPGPRAKGLTRAIGYALRDAGGPADVDYIAAHGCATTARRHQRDPVAARRAGHLRQERAGQQRQAADRPPRRRRAGRSTSPWPRWPWTPASCRRR